MANKTDNIKIPVKIDGKKFNLKISSLKSTLVDSIPETFVTELK